MGVLATAENDRENDFVFMVEKFLGSIDFRQKIVLADLRP